MRNTVGAHRKCVSDASFGVPLANFPACVFIPPRLVPPLLILHHPATGATINQKCQFHTAISVLATSRSLCVCLAIADAPRAESTPHNLTARIVQNSLSLEPIDAEDNRKFCSALLLFPRTLAFSASLYLFQFPLQCHVFVSTT